MLNCSVCNDLVQRKNGCQCQGKCEKWLHFKCTKLSDQEIAEVKSKLKIFKCNKCLLISPKLGTGLSVSTNKLTKTGTSEPASPGPFSAPIDIGNTLSKLQQDVATILVTVAAVQAQQTEMLNTQQQILEKQRETQETLNKHEDYITKLEYRIDCLEVKLTEYEDMKTEVHSLKTDLTRTQVQQDDWEQNKLLDSIEIKGLPVLDKNALQSTIEQLIKITHADLNPKDIERTTQVQKGKRAGQVILKFSSCDIRDKALESFKNRKNCLIKDICPSMSREKADDKIHFNELLTIRKKIMFSKSKKFAKDNDITYLWTKHGQILMRKQTGDPYVIVKTDSDWQKLFPKVE